MFNKLKAFLDFEKDKRLFSRAYLGVPYWQSIRITFSRSVTMEKKLFSRKSNPSHVLKQLLKCGNNIITDIWKYISLTKCDILYFDECAYRLIDGTTVDSYFDYFELDKEYKVQRCFHIYSRQKETSLDGIGTVIPKLEDHLLMLCSKMHICKYRDEKEEAFLEQLAQDLEAQFHMGFSFEEIVQMVRRIVVIHKVYRKYYEKIIRKCRPKSIIVVAHYSSYLFPLYNLAQKYSIPVIELQHGLIVNHDAYWYEDTSTIGKELPSYLFTYGEFWSNYINMPKNIKIVPVGNPFLEARKEKYKNNIPDEKMMVFYSASEVAKEMEQLAIDAWNRLGKRGYKIYFKIHPLEYDKRKEQYRLLSEYPQIRIVPPDKDLYELLSSAKHHISYASTVLYEATIFDNNRYIFDFGNFAENMKPLIDSKLAYKFRTLEELVLLLNRSMGTVFDDMFEIWKINAKKNGIKKIREIMDESKYKEKR